MADIEIQDFLVEDIWTDKKTGEEHTALRKLGVSIKMKGGGWRHKLYRNVSISGEALSLPQRKKGMGEDSACAGEDSGDGLF